MLVRATKSVYAKGHTEGLVTDFRVPLPDAPDSETDRELDWEGDIKQWRLSEKDYGDVRWTQNLDPPGDDLSYLRVFFAVERWLSPKDMTSLSPGELAAIHAQESSPRTVLAALCSDCNLHWTIFKFESGDHSWHRYGRTCSYSWLRGKIVTPDTADPLLKVPIGAAREVRGDFSRSVERRSG
jgi:hypothetical protein